MLRNPEVSLLISDSAERLDVLRTNIVFAMNYFCYFLLF
jgi:hypothetical protein